MKQFSGESDSKISLYFFCDRRPNLTDCLSHIRDNCVQSNFAMEVLNRLLDVLDTPDEPGRLSCPNMYNNYLFPNVCFILSLS